MDCPECGQRNVFDLKFSYAQVLIGVLGCAMRFQWLFQCRACRQQWLVKRGLARELEQGGVPIPFLQRDGLLIAMLLLDVFLILLLRG